MLYLFINLRYHRQLNKICPDVPLRFFSAIGDSVHKNGGSSTRLGAGMLYSFDEKSIGFSFSTARVIKDLRSLLEELRERIREYFILVDATEGSISPDSFTERVARYNAIITPDEGILFTAHALKFLAPYVSTIPLAGTDLAIYSGPRIIEYAVSEHNSETIPALSLYAGSGDDSIKKIWDLLARAEEPDVEHFLTDEDCALLKENKPARDVYSWFRFSTKQPEYRRDAVLSLFTQQLLARKKVLGASIPITVFSTGSFEEEFASLRDILSGVCIFNDPIKPQFLPADVASMPLDLLDMAYLAYRLMDFLYYNELVSFFKYLGKDVSFIASLGSWLYSYGILADPTDFRSVNRSIQKEVFSRSSASKSINDRKIAEFLWIKFESGALMPTIDLLAVFDTLGFPVSDSFLVSCFFYSTDKESKKFCLKKISSPAVRSMVVQLEKAEKSFSFGEYTSAEANTRDVLHFFQKEKNVYGEFRAFSLLSQLSIVQNKGSDAVAYLGYALENAEQFRNEFSIMETRISLARVHFGIGSFDLSAASVENAEKNAHNCFAKDEQCRCLFIKARIYFEIGDYANAKLTFQTVVSLAKNIRFHEIMELSQVWYARVLSHEGRYHAAEQILAEYYDRIPDAACFRMETAVLSGHTVTDFLLPEPIDADGRAVISGFSTLEDRFITSGTNDSTTSSLYRAFRLYHSARFDDKQEFMECLSGIEDLAKTSNVRHDPYGPLYYYLCFELARYMPVLSQSDGSTFLSHSFKNLQKRAKKVGNNSMREQFLRNPLWNSRIYKAAGKNMLI